MLGSDTNSLHSVLRGTRLLALTETQARCGAHNLAVLDITSMAHLQEADVYSFTVPELLALGRHHGGPIRAIYLDPLWSVKHRYSLEHPDFLELLQQLLDHLGQELHILALRCTQHWVKPLRLLPSFTRSTGRVGERFVFWRSRVASGAQGSELDLPEEDCGCRSWSTAHSRRSRLGLAPHLKNWLSRGTLDFL